MKKFQIRKKQLKDKFKHGDCIFADRGFTVANEFATKDAILKFLFFTACFC